MSWFFKTRVCKDKFVIHGDVSTRQGQHIGIQGRGVVVIELPYALAIVDPDACGFLFKHHVKHVINNDLIKMALTISVASLACAYLCSKRFRPLSATVLTTATTAVIAFAQYFYLEMKANSFAIQHASEEEKLGELRRLKILDALEEQKSKEVQQTLYSRLKQLVVNSLRDPEDIIATAASRMIQYLEVREIIKSLKNETGIQKDQEDEKEKLLAQLFKINDYWVSNSVFSEKDIEDFKYLEIFSKEEKEEFPYQLRFSHPEQPATAAWYFSYNPFPQVKQEAPL